MIPDKIYIRHYWMPGELDDEWRLKPVEDEQCEEYIRKDALLKWLEQNRNQAQMWSDRYNDREDLSAKQVWEEVIDKINSL